MTTPQLNVADRSLGRMVVGGILTTAARRFRDREALYCVGTGRRFTFRQVNQRCNRLAHGLAGLGWCRLRARAPRPAMLLGCVLLAALVGLTWQRNTVYHSETAFWSEVVAKSALHGRAWNNLGYALEHEAGGDPRAALQAYERAIALDPDDFTPQFNRRRLCANFPAACNGEH